MLSVRENGGQGIISVLLRILVICYTLVSHHSRVIVGWARRKLKKKIECLPSLFQE